MRGKLVCGLIAGLMLVSKLCAQTTQIPTSVDSTLVLDAAGPEQRKSLGAIYLIVCPGGSAGTGFLLESGVIVTNAHVIGTCNEQTLFALTAENHRIKFNKVIPDAQSRVQKQCSYRSSEATAPPKIKCNIEFSRKL